MKWEFTCGRSPRLRSWTARTKRRTRRRSAARAASSSPGCWRTTTRSASCWPRPEGHPTQAPHRPRRGRARDRYGARQEAFTRLHVGVKVIERVLHKNRRDFRIVGDRQQPAERRKIARQLLSRRRRAAARQIQKLRFQGILLKKPLALLSRIAVRMTDAVVQLKIWIPRPPIRRGGARPAGSRRLVRLTGESSRSLPGGWWISACWPASTRPLVTPSCCPTCGWWYRSQNNIARLTTISWTSSRRGIWGSCGPLTSSIPCGATVSQRTPTGGFNKRSAVPWRNSATASGPRIP